MNIKPSAILDLNCSAIESVSGFGAHSRRCSMTPSLILRGRHYGHSEMQAMDKDYLILKRASTSRPSGEWNDDDYDVLADGAVVGRIMKAAAVPVGMSWMWTLAFGYHEDRTSTHGYAATARPQWRHSAKAGGGNEPKRRPLSGAKMG